METDQEIHTFDEYVKEVIEIYNKRMKNLPDAVAAAIIERAGVHLNSTFMRKEPSILGQKPREERIGGVNSSDLATDKQKQYLRKLMQINPNLVKNDIDFDTLTKEKASQLINVFPKNQDQ